MMDNKLPQEKYKRKVEDTDCEDEIDGKRLCSDVIVHSTPGKPSLGSTIFSDASPLNKYDLSFECITEDDEPTLSSFICDASHYGGILCTNCGKMGDISVSSLHSHSDVDFGYVCPKCGITKEEDPLGDISYSEDKYMEYLLKETVDKLNRHNKPNLILELMKVICEDKLDLDSLTFDIMWDTIKALQSTSLTEVRFTQKSKCFWRFFMEKFGGAPLRALTGWKMSGTLISGHAEPGHLRGSEADLILGIPSEEILKSFDPYEGNWPRQIMPGICEELVERVSKRHENTSVCLAFDGKKLAPGIKDTKGDINLLGKEPDGVTIEMKQLHHQADLDTVTNLMSSVLTTGANMNTDKITNCIGNVLTLLSRKKVELEEMIRKKTYAISMLTALNLEMADINRRNDITRHDLGQVASKLNNYECPLTTNNINIGDCQQFQMLTVEEALNTHQYIQGSEEWFEVRRKASATGSRMFEACGLSGLKAQREYFMERRGKEPHSFTESTLLAMEHGRKHEICAMTTFCTQVLPIYFPDCKVKEVGGIPYENEDLKLVISPDGLLVNSIEHRSAIEIKCPYSGILHDKILNRYYLQIQAEMQVLDVNQCQFISWTETATRVFVAQRDSDVWNMAMDLLKETFGKHVKKAPRLSSGVQHLREKIKKGIESNCKILCEVKSLHSCDNNAIDHHTSNTLTTNSMNRDSKTVPSIDYLCEESLLLLRKQYQASRQKATEVVTFVAGDLDRLWSKDQIHGIPVGYFLRGYSLPVNVVGNILEDFLQHCHQQGLHIPVTCFDGQYMKLLQISIDGKPQTLLELHKQFWNSVEKLSKNKIISEIKACNVDSVKLELDLPGKRITCWSSFAKLPVTSLKQLKESNMRRQSNAAKERSENETIQNNNDNNVDVIIAQDIEDIPRDLISLPEPKDFNDLEMNEHPNFDNEDDDNSRDLQDNEEDTVNESVEDIREEKLGHADIEELRHDLSELSKTWANRSAAEVNAIFKSCENVGKLKISELKVVLKFLRDVKHMKVKVSGTKTHLIEGIKQALELPGCIPQQTNRRKSPVSLKTLSLRILQQKTYPKLALNVSYANWKFEEKLKEWIESSRITHGMEIDNLDHQAIHWFYIPEWHSKRQQLELKKIDPHHLLTRHRSALCKGDIGKAKKSDFLKVAAEGKTQLKPGMMEDRLNMQSTDYSLITFSEQVEGGLQKIGATDSADLCHMVRKWFESCDQPGLSAIDRCKQKLRYRDELLSYVDLNKFPPPGMFIQGYPKQLWEATVASIDVDLLLYALAKRRTFNHRALSSQNCEALYSSLAALPASQNGVPSCIGLETNMAKLCGESIVRLDPNRGFPLRLSSAPVYPQQTLDVSNYQLPVPDAAPTYIKKISVSDHPFDLPSRKRTARHRPRGLSELHEPAKGVAGVRHFHKVDESKLNPLIRLGKSKQTIV